MTSEEHIQLTMLMNFEPTIEVSAEEVEVEDLSATEAATEPGSPAEARAAFVAVAGEISQLRKLSLVNLEQKHLELLGVASAVRSRDALIKQISLALQRRANA